MICLFVIHFLLCTFLFSVIRQAIIRMFVCVLMRLYINSELVYHDDWI